MKDKLIGVKMEKSLYEKIKEASQKKGMTNATYLRMIAIDYFNKKGVFNE
jgi:predicted DNA binding CopG/RHH family protein